MTLTEAMKILDEFRLLCQNHNAFLLFGLDDRNEVVEAFKVYWASNPTMEQFAVVMSKMIVLTEFMYIMCKEK